MVVVGASARKGIDRLSGENRASAIYVNRTFSLLMAHARHFNVHCAASHYTTLVFILVYLAYLVHRSRPTMGGRLHGSTG